MSWLETYFKGDRTIWLTVIILSIFSILAVYSSTGTLAYKYQSGNTEYYLFKHFFILVFGFGLMYAAHLLKYTVYSRVSKIAILVAIPLLILTLALGTNLNEASRWLTLPIVNLSFQTSDLAKLALILFVARALSKRQDTIKDFKTGFLPIMGPVVLTCMFILPANFSTAAVLFTTCVILMVIGRVEIKYIMILLGTGLVALALFIGIAKLVGYEGRIDTWEKRIETFMNDEGEGNYQSDQAKIAIAKGQLLGIGPGNSSQRNYLPHPYSDFIYAIIVEEYGLLGGALIVVLYLVLFYRAIKIAQNTPRAFATFLAIGCAFSLTFQAMINMAVTVNLFPVTGQPLPMLSMGGTSIWFTSIAIGIILSVSRDLEKEEGVKKVEAVA
ncbi:MAG: FtsW/RodA/SpoVE family cell cycle protein [Bacteroidia bacterium]|nr:FtsW/RodA/SpoVE family cell cycle protein [Bacteroidota bacterium]MBK8875340.1 FtsW/RodA/SpoVE family cell cycle protein [Bacteroidota bacterium]MBP9083129.1 FtsW/RodA/SpoVE family cell cycle protein [Bacteroidia bacterium]